jgi:hypothetical protein
MERRSFLKWAGAGAATAAIAHRFGGSASAAPFGEFPVAARPFALPDNVRAKRVLEIFCYGGLSSWETLYLVRNYGSPGSAFPGTQFHAFDHAPAITGCQLPPTEIGQFLGQDAAGADVELGLYASRLWNRPDVTDRMRVVVNAHRLEPHEAAVPTALTGRSVGQPGAGLGAHVQRYQIDAGAGRATPHSYVFATGGLSSDNVESAASTGMHSGAAKPLLIKVDNAQGLSESLARSTVGARRGAHDALSSVYLNHYNERLKWPGTTTPLRAARVGEYGIALDATKNVDAIANVLGNDVFQARPATLCGQSRSSDIPLMSIEAARHLLTHPTEPASYVCVSDIGLFEASGGGGYDTHSQHVFDTARNFDNMLKSLLGVFNGPGETDPRKLNFDDTLVVINSEFGRTPEAQGFDGRNHWPYGYATAFIGGPIKPGQKGVYGAIGPDGRATVSVDPAECRAAALLAMGIYPFSAEAFATSDAVERVLEHCFGWGG